MITHKIYKKLNKDLQPMLELPQVKEVKVEIQDYNIIVNNIFELNDRKSEKTLSFTKTLSSNSYASSTMLSRNVSEHKQ